MDECYPAISMTTAINGHKNTHNVHSNNNNYINYLQTLQQNNVSLHNNNNSNHHNNNKNSNSNLNNNNNNHLINSNSMSMLHNFKFSHKKKGSDVSSTTSGSDFEIDSDEATIKEEPMSPSSSCPPSPTQCGGGYTVSSMNLANMAAYTNSDLVFDHNVSAIVLLITPPISNNHFNIFSERHSSHVKWTTEFT